MKITRKSKKRKVKPCIENQKSETYYLGVLAIFIEDLHLKIFYLGSNPEAFSKKCKFEEIEIMQITKILMLLYYGSKGLADER